MMIACEREFLKARRTLEELVERVRQAHRRGPVIKQAATLYDPEEFGLDNGRSGGCNAKSLRAHILCPRR